MDNEGEQDFNKYADDYRKILKENIKKFSEFDSNYFSEYKVKIVKDVLDEPAEKILDFGCGDGISCAFFNKYFPNSTITGIDVSLESIKIAINKQIPNASFIHYKNEKLPFKDESFDVVFIACVLHHINKQNHRNLINELKRVLKKNGELFIFEHNPFNIITRKMVKDCIFDENAELIYAKSLKNTVIKSGFSDVKVNYTLFFPRYKILEKCFSLEKYLRRCNFGAQYYIKAKKD